MPYFFYFEKVVELTEIIDKVYEKIKIISDVSLNEVKTKLIIESVIQDCINYMNRENFPEELITPTATYIYKYNFVCATFNIKTILIIQHVQI